MKCHSLVKLNNWRLREQVKEKREKNWRVRHLNSVCTAKLKPVSTDCVCVCQHLRFNLYAIDGNEKIYSFFFWLVNSVCQRGIFTSNWGITARQESSRDFIGFLYRLCATWVIYCCFGSLIRDHKSVIKREWYLILWYIVTSRFS